MPIAAKPCAARRCKTNTPNFPQHTVAPQKLETFINGCSNWQLDNFGNSESAALIQRIDIQHQVRQIRFCAERPP
jgi:hypothetical protein